MQYVTNVVINYRAMKFDRSTFYSSWKERVVYGLKFEIRAQKKIVQK